MKPPPKSIDHYLVDQTEEVRITLEKLRHTILTTAPGAVEVISYGMPAFKLNGYMLVGFAAFKKHCSLFPWNGHTVEEFAKELKNYTTSKGTIQFTLEKPLPVALVKKIVKARIQDIKTKSQSKPKK